VDIEIEDRDGSAAGIQHALGCNRCVVEVAEPAGHIGVGVMAGRAAQRIGVAVACQDAVGRVDRCMGGSQRGGPARLDDWGAGAAEIPAGLSEKGVRTMRRVANGIGLRPQDRSRQRQRLVAPECGFQQCQVGFLVDPPDRCQAVRAGWLCRHATGPQGAEQCVGPSRNFPVVADITGQGDAVGIMGGVVGRYDNHRRMLASANAGIGECWHRSILALVANRSNVYRRRAVRRRPGACKFLNLHFSRAVS
jgi:hypothetical protein